MTSAASLEQPRAGDVHLVDPDQVLVDHYGIAGATVHPLGGEVDRNLRVDTADGRRYLMKITVGEPSEIQWQEAILEHVASRAPELPVPRLVAGLRGERHLAVPAGRGPAVVRLMTWLDGSMIADVEPVTPSLLHDIGSMSARLTLALEDFPPEAMAHDHHWDVRTSQQAVDACLPFVSDRQDRARVATIMDSFAAVQASLSGLPMGVVHQDLNDFNVLASRRSDGEWGVSGIIDFGDALYTVRVADLAVAAAYAMLRQPDPVEALCTVVAGFDEQIPLTEGERAVVFPLAAARLCVNVTTWTRRTQESHQPYGLERMRFTWPTIRRIADEDPSDVVRRINAGCALGAARSRRPDRNG